MRRKGAIDVPFNSVSDVLTWYIIAAGQLRVLALVLGDCSLKIANTLPDEAPQIIRNSFANPALDQRCFLKPLPVLYHCNPLHLPRTSQLFPLLLSLLANLCLGGVACLRVIVVTRGG